VGRWPASIPAFEVGTTLAVSCLTVVTGVTQMSNEIEASVEAYSTPPKGAARRRVDAYHEALRERNALRELEEPFLHDMRSWHPRR
jgi:hypothetical protein